MKQYIERADGITDGPLYQLYGALCQITHPAAYSLSWALMMRQSEEKDSMRITPTLDGKHIAHSLVDDSESIRKIVGYSLNLPLISLKTINLFNLPTTKTPFLDLVDMNGIPMWHSIWETYLKHKPSNT